MIKKFKNWLREIKGSRPSTRPATARRQPARRQASRHEDPAREAQSQHAEIAADSRLEGHLGSLGPGKNVLIRNKFVREDTGTHETLKIIDEDTLIDTGEETGIDPYNTGGFDRSKNWDARFRK